MKNILRFSDPVPVFRYNANPETEPNPQTGAIPERGEKAVSAPSSRVLCFLDFRNHFASDIPTQDKPDPLTTMFTPPPPPPPKNLHSGRDGALSVVAAMLFAVFAAVMFVVPVDSARAQTTQRITAADIDSHCANAGGEVVTVKELIYSPFSFPEVGKVCLLNDELSAGSGTSPSCYALNAGHTTATTDTADLFSTGGVSDLVDPDTNVLVVAHCDDEHPACVSPLTDHDDNPFTACAEPTDVDECQTNDGGCPANSLCTDSDKTSGNGVGVQCKCVPAYQGGGTVAFAPDGGTTTCTDTDECAIHRNSCGTDAQCVNTVGSHHCTCNQGYRETTQDPQKPECRNINECTEGTHNCVNGTCADLIRGTAGRNFSCDCNPGWGGDACDIAQRTVRVSLAMNGTLFAKGADGMEVLDGGMVPDGTTVTFTADPDNGYYVSGWTGCAATPPESILGNNADGGNKECAAVADADLTVGAMFSDIDECAGAVSCVNGSCENLPGRFRCKCDAGWGGGSCNAALPEAAFEGRAKGALTADPDDNCFVQGWSDGPCKNAPTGDADNLGQERECILSGGGGNVTVGVYFECP